MFRSAVIVAMLFLISTPALAAMSAADRQAQELRDAVGRSKNMCAEFRNADGTYGDDPANPNPRWSQSLAATCPAADAADKAISAGSSSQ